MNQLNTYMVAVDKAFFAAHPDRNLLLRPATPTERATFGMWNGRDTFNSVLVERMNRKARLRAIVFQGAISPADIDDDPAFYQGDDPAINQHAEHTLTLYKSMAKSRVNYLLAFNGSVR